MKNKININEKKNKYKKNDIRDGWIFIGLGFLLFVVFVFYPQIKNFVMAFTEYNILPGKPSKFIGLSNFKEMFFSSGPIGESQYFFIALRNSLLAVLVTVPGQLIIGLIIAVMIQNLSKGRVTYKVLLYIPVISSWVVVSVLFKYLFQDTSGSLVNYILLKIGIINQPISWLHNEWTANLVIWILCIWKGVGWVMIIYSAALQSLPTNLYESAEIDGASKFQQFIYLTIPLLRRTTIYIIVQLTIGAFGIMTQVIMITGGGPLGTTETLNSYMYKKAFSEFEFGYASAVSIIMGLVVILITTIQRKLVNEKEVNY